MPVFEVPLSRILDISVDKPLHGRILDFGHFTFESAAQERRIAPKTGDIKWKAPMIPGPGEPGHDTWPEGSHAFGGAGLPEVDARDLAQDALVRALTSARPPAARRCRRRR